MRTANDILTRAVAHHQAGRLTEAATLYRGLLCEVPQEANALHLRGLARWRLGHPDEGLALMRRSLAVAPDFEPCYLNIVNLLRTLERTDEAVAWLERGVQALPGSLPLRELFCSLSQDLAIVAIRKDDREAAAAWAARSRAGLLGAPVLNRTLYEVLERQIQIDLVTGRRDAAVTVARAKNRADFASLPESEIDVFAVDLLGFPEWCEAAGLRARTWEAAAQPAPETLCADYPDYLHQYVETLPDLGRTPVGVALDAGVEVIQGFYVKDNYECFVLADRRSMLCENRSNVVRSSVVPLVGVTPEGQGVIRLPRPLYRTVDITEPAIFVPSTPNYWHFMVEVLPQLMLCDAVPEARDLPVVLFDTRGYQFEMFDLAGIARERIVDMRKILGPDCVQVLYRFQRAAVPSQVPYPVAVRLLRERFLPQVRPGRPPLPRRVFLSRRGSYPKHRIANDAEVGALLERYGFQVVLPESLSVLETIELIAQAEMVVAPIGAGTSNHVFLPPYGTWIHLNNPDFFHPESSWNAQMGTQATLVGAFRHLTGRFAGDPASFPERLVDRLEIPIEIDLDALARLVEEAEGRLARRESRGG